MLSFVKIFFNQVTSNQTSNPQGNYQYLEILHLLLSSRRPRRVFHILNKNLEFQNFTSIRNVKVKKITYILTKKGMWIWASDKSEDILNQNIILIWHQLLYYGTQLLSDILRKSRYNPVFSLFKKEICHASMHNF